LLAITVPFSIWFASTSASMSRRVEDNLAGTIAEHQSGLIIGIRRKQGEQPKPPAQETEK
jgi:hypothetical protein